MLLIFFLPYNIINNNNVMLYYTKNDINKMIKNNRKIVLVKNIIYDVTDFDHPFGLLPFTDKIGKDIRQDYDFHGRDAKKKWNDYKIGELHNNNLWCIII
jgi:hypothetical protein